MGPEDGFEPSRTSYLLATTGGIKPSASPEDSGKLGANGWTQTSYGGVMSAATIHFVLAGKLAGDSIIEML